MSPRVAFVGLRRRGLSTLAVLAIAVRVACAGPANPARGTDFANFYAGQLPELTLAGGGDQGGAPGTTLPEPIAVKVAGGLQNAPVTFTVTSGEALLTATGGPDEKSVAALDARAVVPVPKSAGNYTAQVYVRLLGEIGAASTITASVRSGDQNREVSTTVTVTDPGLKPPVNFRIIKSTATTAEVAWTPSDPKLATRIEASYDDGATWKAVGTVPPGTTSTTLYQFVPDHEVSLRGVTVRDDGKIAPERLIAPKR